MLFQNRHPLEMRRPMVKRKTGQEMLQLRKEAEKKAATPEAPKNPTTLLAASKARMLADVEMVKADLSYRQAYVQVMSLIGGQ